MPTSNERKMLSSNEALKELNFLEFQILGLFTKIRIRQFLFSLGALL